LLILRGNVACDKGVKIPLGYAVSPFKKRGKKLDIIDKANFNRVFLKIILKLFIDCLCYGFTG
jgi:hypothetical protein